MESEEDEIKSKQASKKDRTLNMIYSELFLILNVRKANASFQAKNTDNLIFLMLFVVKSYLF